MKTTTNTEHKISDFVENKGDVAKFGSYIIFEDKPTDGFMVYLRFMGKVINHDSRIGYLLEAFYTKVNDKQANYIDIVDLFIFNYEEASSLFQNMMKYEGSVGNLIDVATDMGINFEVVDRSKTLNMPA